MYWVKKRLVWACLKGVTLEKTFKEESTHKNHYDDNYSAPFTLTIITIQYSDTINISNLKIKHFDDNYNLVYSDTTKCQLFQILVYTVWTCLKGMTLQKTLKEESTNKNH